MAIPKEKQLKKSTKDLFADVVVDLPVEGVFTYLVPPALCALTQVGKRVLVPFGKRTITGYIVKIKDESKVKNLKEFIDFLDDEPIFDAKRLKFFMWLASYYFAYPGEVLALIHPGFLSVKSQRFFTLTDKGTASIESAGSSSLDQLSIEILKKAKGGVKLKSLLASFKSSPVRSALKGLKADDLISEEVRLTGGGRVKREKIYRAVCDEAKSEIDLALKNAPVQARLYGLISSADVLSLKEIKEEVSTPSDALKSLITKGFIEQTSRETGSDALDDITARSANFELTDAQKEALGSIKESLNQALFAPYLLYGVTGSGKTLVYLKAVEEVIRLGKKALVLVPEIALTPRTAGYLTRSFPGRVALLHSSLGDAERFFQWQRIKRGEVDVVIGTRSALFCPIDDLALIVVDEEHETSYKQEEGVRYSARDCALMLGQMLGATVVLGSATPSLETFYNAQNGKLKRIDLPDRVMNKSMPEIEIMDMKPLRKSETFSKRLLTLIGETLDRAEQCLIFLNRRGFSNFMICSNCGYIFECQNCSVSLTLHKGANSLRCHYCDSISPIPKCCPACSGSDFDRPGSGTEKVEQELKDLFPTARICRMDRDTTRKKGAASSMLDAMDAKNIDILIGTQMVSKGHDFPGITLVGVINADTSLNIPDFRGAERTFQLIAQAAGRAGRGEARARVVVQTLNPDHFCFLTALNHDYDAFYAQEIKERADVSYPPFIRLCSIRLDSPSEANVTTAAEDLKGKAQGLIRNDKRFKAIRVLGPAPALVYKVRGRYRWHFLIKEKDPAKLIPFVAELKSWFKSSAKNSVNLIIDMDPITTT